MTGGVDDGTVSGEHDILDEVDDVILRRLRAAASHLDPLPDGLVERAQFAVAWTEVEAELAELIDSTSGRLAGVRGEDPEVRSMTFSAEFASMTVMVKHQRSGRRIDGWLSDVDESVIVRLRRLGGSQEASLTGEGRFEFDDVPPGPVQLLVVAADDETRLLTPTIEI